MAKSTRLLLAVVSWLSALPPAIAAEAIWIEGEDPAVVTTFNRHSWYERSADLRRDLMSPGEVEVTDGAWLAHYTTGDPTNTAQATWTVNVTEGGTYTWWLRCNPIWATMQFAVDGAAMQPLDLSDYRERVNIVRTIDIRWLAWVKVGEFALAPGAHTVSVRVVYTAARDESHGGVDSLALVNYPWEPIGVLRPGQVIAPSGPDVWFPLRAGDDPFSAASITDMSGLLDPPAGRFGPVRRVGRTFEFRDRPGVAVKFWGTGVGAPLATETLQRQQARLFAKNGINLVRIHPLQNFLGVLRDPGTGTPELDPQPLAVFDRWFSILKEHGIYLELSAFYPHVVTAVDGYPTPLLDELDFGGAGKSSSGMVAFMPELQQGEWTWLRTFLQHVNPHTGVAYKDDPALAIVEVHNEDSIFWHWPLNPLSAGVDYPLHTAELKRQWMQWVAAEYGDDVALAAAWRFGMRAGDSVSNPAMDIYGAWQMGADGPEWGAGPLVAERPRLGDFIRFLADTQSGYYRRRGDELRALGYQGIFVTTAWRAGGPAAEAANLYCDDVGDAIDRHSYFGGGFGGHYVATGVVNNASHLDQPGRGIVGAHTYDSGGELVTLYQVEDKPTVMSEWTSSTPNQWKAEIAPLEAFYGMGLNGWDASLHFASSLPRMGSGWPSNARAPDSYVTETPHYLGQFPALAFAIHHGHIQEADVAAARRIATADIFAGIDALSRDLPGGGYPSETNVRTPPEVMAIGRFTFKTEVTPPLRSEKVDWSIFWDTTARTVASMTGDLTWDYDNRVVTIQAAKTQGVVGFAGGRSYDLPGVQIDVTTGFVSLLLTPLDDRALIDSQHILVTALARDKQLNTTYNGDGTQLLQVGGPPLLLEPVQATLTFKGGPVTSARVVDLHGVPTATSLPIASNAVTIDGRYETYYYEIRRDDPCDPYLARTGVTTLSPLGPGRGSLFRTTPDADGLTLEPAAPFAEIPYLCPFASAMTDPETVLDPTSNPLIFYQVSGNPSGPIQLIKDGVGRTVRLFY